LLQVRKQALSEAAFAGKHQGGIMAVS